MIKMSLFLLKIPFFLQLFSCVFWGFFLFCFLGHIGSSFAAHRLSLVVASRVYSSLQCAGFSLRWLLLLQSTGSSHTGFSSYGAWAQ